MLTGLLWLSKLRRPYAACCARRDTISGISRALSAPDNEPVPTRTPAFARLCPPSPSELVEILMVNFCIPVDLMSDNGITPLHLAMCLTETEILETLAQFSGMPLRQFGKLCHELQDDGDQTPVDYAKQQGCHESVRLVQELLDYTDDLA
eukprot:1191872-Prorocentrum_minimum.AAC.2